MVQLITTLGPKRADELGLILPHEHVFVDLRTWAQLGYAQAEIADVVALMGPEIARAQAAGVTALVKCSTVGVGRRPDILKAVSDATGLPLVVPTGVYREPWIPPWIQAATAAELTTNAVIGSHTIRGRVVRDQLRIIEDVGYGPERFIWIHT